MIDELQPLERFSAGVWVTACNRFVLYATRTGWIVMLCSGSRGSALQDWLADARLDSTTFPRRRDALAALHAHLSTSPPPSTRTAELRWKRAAPDRLVSSCGIYTVQRTPDGWRLHALNAIVGPALTLRAAKQSAARLEQQ